MILLPTYTFLNAPKEAGKTTLIGLLQNQDPDLGVYALADPLYDSMGATYFPDQVLMLDFNLRDPASKRNPLPIPRADGSPLLQREWLIEYGLFLSKLHGKGALAKLVLRQIEANARWYLRSIIDGTRIPEDFTGFPLDECLLIHIERRGAEWSGDLPGTIPLTDIACRHVTIKNDGAPEDMLVQLEKLLGSTETKELSSKELSSL